jgi:hypothetical protein
MDHITTQELIILSEEKIKYLTMFEIAKDYILKNNESEKKIENEFINTIGNGSVK